MDSLRHKTQKRHIYVSSQSHTEQLQLHLEKGQKDAYARQWHRIERGLRLNRIRLFIEDISNEYAMNKEEKDNLFLFLQKALDKKLLNTLKVVHYDLTAEKILSIKGLSIQRNDTGMLVFDLDQKDGKKPRTDTTRKRKKEEVSAVSIPSVATGATGATTVEDKIELDEEKGGE